MRFIENLERMLKERDITIYKMSKDIGINPNTIGNYKKKTLPKIDIVEKIASYLGVTIDELILDTSYKHDNLTVKCNHKTINERMFDLLISKGLKQSDLANYLNVEKSVITAWKRRGTNPPSEYIIRICDFLGISVYELLEENVKGNNNDVAAMTKDISNSNGITINEKIFTMLEHKGLKQSDLARYLNVNTSVITTWKTRGTNPPSDMIVPISQFFQISTDELLGLNDLNRYDGSVSLSVDSSSNISDIVKRIIDLSEQHNITGKALGQILGLRKSPLTDWANQKSKPTLEQVMKICDVFKVSADYILFGKSNCEHIDNTAVLMCALYFDMEHAFTEDNEYNKGVIETCKHFLNAMGTSQDDIEKICNTAKKAVENRR